jgi:DNA or RNA helicases of superfamily II
MSIALFAHNRVAYESALTMLAETGKAAVIHPTGTGKSFIGFKLAEDYSDKRICWLSPSEYIFKTQIENLANVTDGWKPENITFFTYAKLMLMSDEAIADIQPEFIIFDEFHRCGAEQWGKGVDKLLNEYEDIPVLGFSATNIRYLDNQRDMADELFDGNIASEITLGEAIVRGILMPPKYVISVFSYRKDLEQYQQKVKRAKSKAVRDAAQKYLDSLRRTLEKADGLDKVFEKHMTDRNGKYIVFCANVSHLNEMIDHVPEWFRGVDKQPHVYTAYADDPEASKDFADFKADDSDHLKLLFCIDMLNEGVHVDDISGVILFRPTVSPIIYKQQIGRALSAGKNNTPLILDVINNFDNLYSIGAIEDEMQTALTYYHSWGDGEEIVNERFHVIDEVRDCRVLFDQLHETLSASWDLMYQAAKEYYSVNGNLNVPKTYKTSNKLALGTWVITQRRVKAGSVSAILTEHQIEKLDTIGMVWENRFDLSWNRNYEAAKAYHAKYGNLDIAYKYVTDDGIMLGNWISTARQQKIGNSRSKYLTEERIEQLNELGMIWSKISYAWEQNYVACVAYHIEHDNLDIPLKYVSKDGLKIGVWLQRMRNVRSGRSYGSAELTDDQITRLDAIGMEWSDKFTRQWEYGYTQAVKYREMNGNLDVPVRYMNESGFPLGRWLERHRDGSTRMTDERRMKLDTIGMIWEKESSWEKWLELCKDYYETHGNLNTPYKYTVDGVQLNKWISLQKQAYREGQLTDEQIHQLEGVGIDWLSSYERIWETYYESANQYYRVNGNLDVSYSYKGDDGVALGKWLGFQRKYRANGTKKTVLTDERIQRLDEIGMNWDKVSVSDEAWERGYTAAVEYYSKHGTLLNMPREYVSDSGVKLASWINNMKSKLRGTGNQTYKPLTNDQIRLLRKIGITSVSKSELCWQENYEKAKAYYEEHGNLNVRSKYTTESGFKLGSWLYANRKARDNPDNPKIVIDDRKIALLDEIGMNWNKPIRDVDYNVMQINI